MNLLRRCRFHPLHPRAEQLRMFMLGWASLFEALVLIFSLGTYDSDARCNLTFSDWWDGDTVTFRGLLSALRGEDPQRDWL